MPKLLLADDSVTIQRVIELTFADEDVQVLTAGDGEQAIARVQADLPDIVLADIGMPKRSGYDVAAYIKGRPEFSHIPVLLLTGAFEPVDEGRAQAAGCDGVLVKPFEPQQVIARVRELLAGAKGSAARAVADVPRPVERLAPPRPPEPRGDEQPAALSSTRSQQSVDDFDFGVQPMPGASAAPEDALDDYFDRLDAAFANIASPGESPPAPPHEPQVMPRAENPFEEKELDWFDHPPTGAIEGSPAHVEETRVPEPAEPPPAPPATFASPPSTSFDWLPNRLEGPVLGRLDPQAPSGIEGPAATPIEPPDLSASISPQPSPPVAQPPATVSKSPVADAFSALLAVEQGEAVAGPVRIAMGSPRPELSDEVIDEIARRVAERLGPEAVRDIVSQVTERLVREEIERIRSGGRR